MTDAEPPPAQPSWRTEPVQRRLRIRQLTKIGIGLVVLVLAIVDLVDGVVGPLGALAGFLGGAVVGLLGLRINRVGWDAGTARVVARADRIGLLILVALLVARLSRDRLLEHWITGARLTALGLWITAGTLVVRVVGTRRAVVAALPDGTPTQKPPT